MTTVDSDAAFRERLSVAVREHNLGVADYIIHTVSQAPAEILARVENCHALLFALELWAACFGHPHPAISHVERNSGRMWRIATTPEQAVTALSWLSESPFGAEFAEDAAQLHPRLVSVVQDCASRQAVPSTHST